MGSAYPVEMSGDFTCPKCGKPAELENGYDTLVVCKDCGETRIIMNFLSNGDIETITADTKEYYELEPSVREALSDLDAAGTPEERVQALSVLSDRYSETGREAKAENLAKEVLAEMRRLAEAGDADMRRRYMDQVPICAAYAISRGDADGASSIYLQALEFIGDDRSIQAASMKVNYAFLCTMRKDNNSARKALEESMDVIKECFARGEKGDDPYLLATVYDALRVNANKDNDKGLSEDYAYKALEERRRLLDQEAPVSARLIEFADSMGFVAEMEVKKGNTEKATAMMDEAVQILEGYPDNRDAYAFALMNRAKYRQTLNPELPEGFLEEMDAIISALEPLENKDKRTMENIAQAYMFRSMVRDPNDYDLLLGDLKGAFDNLMTLAQYGDVNEMFFMSTAHSYLVLLNMKDADKAQEVREQLAEMGISQKDLDKATRGTIGNVSSKKTKVDLLSSQEAKPIPGRRLKRQVRHKEGGQ